MFGSLMSSVLAAPRGAYSITEGKGVSGGRGAEVVLGA
jgi:hypothetical protein